MYDFNEKTIFAIRKLQVMAEETTEQKDFETQEEGNGGIQLENRPDFLESNMKPIGIVVGIVAVLVIGWVGYQKYMVEPMEIEASTAIWQAENKLLDEGDLVQAIKGDTLASTFRGFKALSDEYDGYKAGEIAQFNLGIAYLKNGQYQDAILALEGVEFSDELLSTEALGAMGDAYAELGDHNKAVAAYEKAMANSKNGLTSPIYMIKAAASYELIKDFKKATAVYQELIEKYPTSTQANDAKKYIVFTEKGMSIYAK